MAPESKPPKTYADFVQRFPELGEAWDLARKGERAGPLDRKVSRLIKLGIAAGCLRQGAVRSGVRKARSAGASEEEIYQVVALAATTIGLPSAVAVFSWVREALAD